MASQYFDREGTIQRIFLFRNILQQNNNNTEEGGEDAAAAEQEQWQEVRKIKNQLKNSP